MFTDQSSSPSVLGLRIDVTSYSHATETILSWALQGLSKFVCAANVHMAMEAWDGAIFKELINNADMVLPDGMPLVWGLKLLRYRGVTRVRGPELMLEVCKQASLKGIPIGLYGGREEFKENLLSFLKIKFPSLKVVCIITPPFRSLTLNEQEQVIKQFNDCDTRVIFVGIGCPKQEYWMADHRDKINAVMIGVGAAFDIFSGRKPSAPRWMQDYGLEWFFRLMIEPRRLWKRYLKHNTRFVFLFVIQWIASIFGYKLFNLRKEN